MGTVNFAGNGRKALGAVRAFMDQGMNIPDAVLFIDYRDLASARSFLPPQTTRCMKIDNKAASGTCSMCWS
jgi:DNA-binding LacI/PurR family transcriptional regulator